MMSWIAWLWIGLVIGSLVLLFLAARYLIIKLVPAFSELEKLSEKLVEMEQASLSAPEIQLPTSSIGDDPIKHIQVRLKLIKEKQARKQLRERRLIARLKAMSNKESR
jgi:hypothetical protein